MNTHVLFKRPCGSRSFVPEVPDSFKSSSCFKLSKRFDGSSIRLLFIYIRTRLTFSSIENRSDDKLCSSLLQSIATSESAKVQHKIWCIPLLKMKNYCTYTYIFVFTSFILPSKSFNRCNDSLSTVFMFVLLMISFRIFLQSCKSEKVSLVI